MVSAMVSSTLGPRVDVCGSLMVPVFVVWQLLCIWLEMFQNNFDCRNYSLDISTAVNVDSF
jgi:hypothetical protein